MSDERSAMQTILADVSRETGEILNKKPLARIIGGLVSQLGLYFAEADRQGHPLERALQRAVVGNALTGLAKEYMEGAETLAAQAVQVDSNPTDAVQLGGDE